MSSRGIFIELIGGTPVRCSRYGSKAMLHLDRFWTRRDFLKLAGQAGLVSAFPTLASAAAALEPDTICISILHTTDLHGHILPTSDYDGNADRGGMARCVTQIRRWRRENPNSILIDVGDVYQGTEVSLHSKGELMIDLFNHLGYDAWVVGNHEFDWGVEPFHQALQRSRMPVLAVNTMLEGKTAGEFPDVAAFIAGHTHQTIPSRLSNGVLFTQADHFGIHVGRVDLLFDRNSKKLLDREAISERMDNRIHFDRVVISRAKSQLAESGAALAEPIGELAETLHARSRPGRPSDIERLIGAAIMEALRERNIPVDGVMHGVFDENANLVAGAKRVNEIWNMVPYENYIVTAALSPDEIKTVMEEVYASHERRNLLGIEVETEGRGSDRRITSMKLAGGRSLERGKKYMVDFNSLGSRSDGHHFMKLRALLETPSVNYVMHPVQTRDALIDYFRRHKIVHKIAAAGELAAAA